MGAIEDPPGEGAPMHGRPLDGIDPKSDLVVVLGIGPERVGASASDHESDLCHLGGT